MAIALVATGCQEPGVPCRATKDCLNTEVCVANLCRRTCNATTDCKGNELCRNGACMAPADAGTVDAATSDGAPADRIAADALGSDRRTADGNQRDRGTAEAAAGDSRGTDHGGDAAAGFDRALFDAGPCAQVTCPANTTCTETSPSTTECRCRDRACAIGESCLAPESPAPGEEGLIACCRTDLHNCGGSCVDLASEVGHCGSCRTRCAFGETCSSGQCACGAAPACDPAAEDCCAGSCRRVLTDRDHCGLLGTGGGCGHACASGSSCVDGRCACSGTGDCGGGAHCCDNSYCADFTDDVANCGGCHNACRAGETCVGSTCVCGPTCDDGVACTEDVCTGNRCEHPTLDGDDDGYCHASCLDIATGGPNDCRLGDGDCGDTNALVHPGAPDVCNGVDDDCGQSTADGASDCPGRCCGAPTPSCKQCCSASQCGSGLGDWQCVDGNCRCGGGVAGVVCDGTCHGSGQCCTPSDCGTGAWNCGSDHQCSCAFAACSDRHCRTSGQCCAPADCGAGAWTCASDHACLCGYSACGDGFCRTANECCIVGDCAATTCPPSWIPCEGFADVCDTTGTQSRVCQDATSCSSAHNCVTTPRTETQSCTRGTDGVTCNTTLTCCGGGCIDPSTSCQYCGGCGTPCLGGYCVDTNCLTHSLFGFDDLQHIRMADNLERHLRDVRVGNTVKAYDLGIGQVVTANVTYVSPPLSTNAAWRVVFSTLDVETTAAQLFRSGVTWVRADQLVDNQSLKRLSGDGLSVGNYDISHVASNSQVPTYYLVVDGPHNYFVDSLLVHDGSYGRCP